MSRVLAQVNNHRVEIDALLLCVRPARSDIEVVKIQELISENLDWDYLFKLARRHSLLPLLYKRLDHALPQLPADSRLQQLRLAYQDNLARNLVFADELIQLTEGLAHSGIESIAYKGPVLSVVAYGDLGLRQFVDLDLMVRRRDVMTASRVLMDRGFKPAIDLNRAQHELLLRSQHNLQFLKDDAKIMVELHWQVSSHLFASSVTAEELWQNLETVTVNGSELRTFSIDDLLFSLCVHGSRHLWERLLWIADIAHLVQVRRDVDWPQLLKRADRADARRMFLLGLHLADVLLQAPLPDVVKQKISRDKQIPELTAEIIATLFDGTDRHPATAAQIFRYNVNVRNSWPARFRYMRYTLAPTDSDLGMVRLPAGVRFAYYLLRPMRIFSKHQSVQSVKQPSTNGSR
ncbi:MAG TPA: nucleotidyltransferase family protein [Pyrinomonadaceae bacterium]